MCRFIFVHFYFGVSYYSATSFISGDESSQIQPHLSRMCFWCVYWIYSASPTVQFRTVEQYFLSGSQVSPPCALPYLLKKWTQSRFWQLNPLNKPRSRWGTRVDWKWSSFMSNVTSRAVRRALETAVFYSFLGQKPLSDTSVCLSTASVMGVFLCARQQNRPFPDEWGEASVSEVRLLLSLTRETRTLRDSVAHTHTDVHL